MKTKWFWIKTILLGLTIIITLFITLFVYLLWPSDEVKEEFWRKNQGSLPPFPTMTPCPTPACTPAPNDQQIAFSSNRFDNGYEIYVMNTNGTCVTQLTDFSDFPVENTVMQPGWSPDKRQILFELQSQLFWLDRKYRPSPTLDLYHVTLDNRQVKRLTRQGNNCNAQWSPDGSQIAFKSDRDGEVRLYVMEANSSDQRQFVDIRTIECQSGGWDDGQGYGWSPDGQRIAFTGAKDGEKQWDIYVMDIDSGQLTNLTQHPAMDQFVAWWPQENKILFKSDRVLDEDQRGQQWLRLYGMEADGTNVHRIVDLGIVEPSGHYDQTYYVRGLAPTPDLQVVLLSPQKVVYVLRVPDALVSTLQSGVLPEGAYSSFVLDDPEPNQIVFSGYWSASDPKLTFELVDLSHPVKDILVVNYDGTAMTNLTSCSADDRDPAWSS